MTTVIPRSEAVRRAAEFIADRLQELRKQKKDTSGNVIYNLAEEANLKFDLTPKESIMLHNLLEGEHIGASLF